MSSHGPWQQKPYENSLRNKKHFSVKKWSIVYTLNRTIRLKNKII